MHEQSKWLLILLNTDLAYATFGFQRVNYAPDALLSAETGRKNLDRVAIRPGDYLNLPTRMQGSMLFTLAKQGTSRQ